MRSANAALAGITFTTVNTPTVGIEHVVSYCWPDLLPAIRIQKHSLPAADWLGTDEDGSQHLDKRALLQGAPATWNTLTVSTMANIRLTLVLTGNNSCRRSTSIQSTPGMRAASGIPASLGGVGMARATSGASYEEHTHFCHSVTFAIGGGIGGINSGGSVIRRPSEPTAPNSVHSYTEQSESRAHTTDSQSNRFGQIALHAGHNVKILTKDGAVTLK